MKKKSKRNTLPVRSSSPEQDISGLIIKIQQQLSFLERKIDILIGRIPERPAAVSEKPLHHSQPAQQFQRPGLPQRQNDVKSNNRFLDRPLYKAICADCNKECSIPFKPSGTRPVYCQECFAKRKAGRSPFKEHNNNRPVHVNRSAVPVVTVAAAAKSKTGRASKPAEIRNKAVSKKKKK